MNHKKLLQELQCGDPQREAAALEELVPVKGLAHLCGLCRVPRVTQLAKWHGVPKAAMRKQLWKARLLALEDDDLEEPNEKDE